jgi:hypothetical protein
MTGPGESEGGRRGVSLVMPVAYDWALAGAAIDAVAPYVDRIIIGLDCEARTWAGHFFDEGDGRQADSLGHWRRKLVDRYPGQVRVVWGAFSWKGDPLANETAERCALALARLSTDEGRDAGPAIRPGEWVLSLDADEIMLNPGDLPALIASADPVYQYAGAWMDVVKVFEGSALVVEPIGKNFAPILSPAGLRFETARFTGQPLRPCALRMLHMTWGRSPDDLRRKLTSWGHAAEVDVPAVMRWWEALTPDPATWAHVRDFVPYPSAPTWPALRLVDLGAGRRA